MILKQLLSKAKATLVPVGVFLPRRLLSLKYLEKKELLLIFQRCIRLEILMRKKLKIIFFDRGKHNLVKVV